MSKNPVGRSVEKSNPNIDTDYITELEELERNLNLPSHQSDLNTYEKKKNS